jgi:hypothetical protein
MVIQFEFFSIMPTADSLELEVWIRRQPENHGIARRENAILLLDNLERKPFIIMGMPGAFQTQPSRPQIRLRWGS